MQMKATHMGGAQKGATCREANVSAWPKSCQKLQRFNATQIRPIQVCEFMRIHTWPREQLDVLQDARETVSGINTYGRQTEAV